MFHQYLSTKFLSLLSEKDFESLVWSAFSALESRTGGIMDVYQHCTKKSYLTKVHENIMTVFRLREWYSIYSVI